MMDFNEKLHFLRKKTSKSQKETADNLGLTRSTYSDYENARTEPNISSIKKISEYFGVTIDFLLTDINEKGKVFQNQEMPNIDPNSKQKGKEHGKDIEHYSSIVAEPPTSYNPPINHKEIEALHSVINTQKDLIDALKGQIALLKEKKEG